MTENQLRLITLGRIALVLPPGRHDEGLNKQRRKLAVLAVLALARRPIARDALVEMFWGGQPEERARHSLSEALSHLRRVLGREAIATRQSDVVLGTPHPLAVDAIELAAAAAAGDDARVVALYEGPFLDAVHLDDAPSFERWIDGERARLEELFVKACERQALVLARARRWTECAELARRWLDAAPLSADAARFLLNALKAPATRASDAIALEAYERLAARLRSDYDAAPDRTVSELADSIRERLRSVPVAPSAPPAVPPVAAHHRSEEELPATFSHPTPARRRRWPAIAAAAAVLVALALASRSRRDGAHESNGGRRTIAVIPFAHLSPDSSSYYLTEGLTAELATALGGVEGLQVMASPSVATLRERKLSARELGEALHVDAVLDGTVRVVGDSARVTVALVDAREGAQLWVGRYDRATRDVLAMQEEIAGAVVEALRARGGAGLARQPARAVDPRAHDLYLRARHLENRSGEANLRRALDYYARALAIDSSVAGAEVGMATATLTLLQWGSTYGEVAPAARLHAEAALRRDPGTPEAHLVLARLLRTDWRWRDAEREFHLALAANPSDAAGWHALSHLYMALDDLPRSGDATRRALALDPLNPRLVMHECLQHALEHDLAEAFAACGRGLELDPNFPDSHAKLAWVYMLAGRGGDAVAQVDREIAVSGATPAYRALRALALAYAGQPDSARAIVAVIDRDTPPARRPLVTLAQVEARLGDRDRALGRLEEAYAEHAAELEDVTTFAEFDPLRGEPRFHALLERLGLPDRPARRWSRE